MPVSVGRGHVVAAVAPPAEEELRQRFMRGLDPRDALLFEKTLLMLQGLPELGVLLKVEQELPALVRSVFGEHGALFDAEDRADWRQAEVRLREALSAFARAARSTYQGQLFADDALQGLRMVDLSNKKFHIVVMNPPFGDRVAHTDGVLNEHYGNGKLDLYNYFYLRAESLIVDGGRIGAITPRTVLFQSKYEGLRSRWIEGDLSPSAVVELDLGVLDDATVRPALVVLSPEAGHNVYYTNLKHSLDRTADLEASCWHYRSGTEWKKSAIRQLDRYSSMPSKRLPLWASDKIIDRFTANATLEPGFGKVTEGLSCEDDARFIRCWWEVSLRG